MNIGTANYVITIQIQNSNIPFKYQVNPPWNIPVGLPKAFQRKTNWKYWIKYIKPIWCPQHKKSFWFNQKILMAQEIFKWKQTDYYLFEVEDDFIASVLELQLSWSKKLDSCMFHTKHGQDHVHHSFFTFKWLGHFFFKMWFHFLMLFTLSAIFLYETGPIQWMLR